MGVKGIFDGIQRRLREETDKLEGMEGTFAFSLTGDGGGDYFVRIGGGTAEAGPGKAEGPDCTFAMSAEDFRALVTGKLNPATAFMTGRVKISGDMGLALKVQRLLG